MSMDKDCPVCAVIAQFKLPADAHDLFHQYVDKLAEMADLLDEASDAGFDFEEGAFGAALEELSCSDVPPKNMMN